ncbi:MAG: PDGLE domain-containing protein [Leptolyngbya sp. IPPAS B-1204]|uniref:Cobalt transport protein n=1 Tax=Leptolyngbya sp. NK1-12 TaxID=2547451 RepID=A0AA97AHZ0_9CYAN|nr:PDGLE domain-containing protein [Leptolyngbya sp. NK1-12]MBF2049178.1 PDGLE domain-containing protein [Elainella sp. C42_A2020_010]RNJ71078.1 MAG: cobalt transport protein [Leptolyngbya sp. IPPAS B-1204]WNZ23236.1 cobalt transport protein [Leptolyngbya sp. NK1-12]
MNRSAQTRNRAFVITGLGIALLVAVLLSPFASSDPDGLDRVAQDHGFDTKATEDAPAQRLPFYNIFEEYALRGAPDGIATPIAGLIGTLVTFGLAWGAGKLFVKGRSSDTTLSDRDYPDQLPR